MTTEPASGGREHWENRYASTSADQVSWYQGVPSMSLSLLEQIGVEKRARLIDIGGGASTLVDHLVNAGWDDVTVLDLSAEALGTARSRIGDDAPVTWIADDLLTWQPEQPFDVWHDRAVFHFLTDDESRLRYQQQIQAAVRPGGHVIVGTFALDGPTQCSGLPTMRYDAVGLRDALGPGLSMVTAETESHQTPSGSVQPFTWVVLQRDDMPS